MVRPLPPLPDPERVGGPGWLARTDGRLTRGQQLRMLARSSTTTLAWVVQHLRPRADVDLDAARVLAAPDSRLVRTATEVAAAQGPHLLGHAVRSAAFARALAVIDGVDVDHELLHVACLLHDLGLVEPVPGEDFTVRGASAGRSCCEQLGEPEAGHHVADAISVHTTIGIEPATDGLLGCYVQWGAMVDLVGLRERHLPRAVVDAVVRAHPREGFPRTIRAAVRAEAKAVPGGRFQVLRCTGFPVVVATARIPSRA